MAINRKTTNLTPKGGYKTNSKDISNQPPRDSKARQAKWKKKHTIAKSGEGNMNMNKTRIGM